MRAQPPRETTTAETVSSSFPDVTTMPNKRSFGPRPSVPFLCLPLMLYEAAQSMLVRVAKWSWLKAWAMKIARRRGMKKAIVALARRLAVIMHRIWVDGTDFRWTGRSPRRDNCTGSNQIGGNLRSTQRWSDVPRGTMDEVRS